MAAKTNVPDCCFSVLLVARRPRPSQLRCWKRRRGGNGRPLRGGGGQPQGLLPVSLHTPSSGPRPTQLAFRSTRPLTPFSKHPRLSPPPPSPPPHYRHYHRCANPAARPPCGDTHSRARRLPSGGRRRQLYAPAVFGPPLRRSHERDCEGTDQRLPEANTTQSNRKQCLGGSSSSNWSPTKQMDATGKTTARLRKQKPARAAATCHRQPRQDASTHKVAPTVAPRHGQRECRTTKPRAPPSAATCCSR